MLVGTREKQFKVSQKTVTCMKSASSTEHCGTELRNGNGDDTWYLCENPTTSFELT